ncbi:uncharacterized protein LOC111101138 isoform X3 [Crassostrea virginica]
MNQTWVFRVFSVNSLVTRFMLIAVIAFANTFYVSPLILKTDDISLNLHQKAEIVLNCTYDKEINEVIGDRDIRWQKWIGNTFKDLATFSPPGGLLPFIGIEMDSLYSNRTELIAPTDGSLSAVLILKELVCDDVGVYRCWVEYYSNKANRESTSFSTVAFEATQPTEFTVFPNVIRVNQSLTLSCSAHVGTPNGNIKIWKLARNSNETELIFTSNTSEYNTQNCTFVNVTFNYTVARKENVALFRCSSQNVLNKGAGPSLESKISVKYGPGKPSIVLTPNKSSFYVGEDVKLQCVSDSNPPCYITWSVLSFNQSKETFVFSVEDELKLKDIQLENAGNYICTAVNEISTNNNNVVINVKELLEKKKTMIFSCDQCHQFENCHNKNPAMKQTWVSRVFRVNSFVTRFMLIAVIAFANVFYVSPLTLKTDDISLNLHQKTEIVLNCTYDKEINEVIGDRDIRWQKWIGNTFKDLATFSSPGGQSPFLGREMESLYSNRTDLIAPTDGSLSAILILKDLVCDDVGEYRCWVDYYFDKANHVSTSPSTVVFEATKPTEFTVFPNVIKVNQSLTLSCSADVGAPNGSIKIWKLARNSNVTDLIFTSNTSENNTENCTFVHVTFNYIVARDENVTLFRCSSQNVLNKGAGPSLDLQISEKYGPDETSSVKESLGKSTTIFSCDRCGRFEICHEKNGEEYCVTNPWMAVAVIFICLCATFVVVITYFLIKHRKSILGKPSTKSTSSRPERDYSLAGLPPDSPHHPSESGGLLSDSGRPILGPTPDDTEAGYSTPKDVKEMKEKSAMLPHQDEHAEITTTCNDENAQYAEVQKKQQTENVYDPDWNENPMMNW